MGHPVAMQHHIAGDVLHMKDKAIVRAFEGMLIMRPGHRHRITVHMDKTGLGKGGCDKANPAKIQRHFVDETWAVANVGRQTFEQ